MTHTKLNQSSQRSISKLPDIKMHTIAVSHTVTQLRPQKTHRQPRQAKSIAPNKSESVIRQETPPRASKEPEQEVSFLQSIVSVPKKHSNFLNPTISSKQKSSVSPTKKFRSPVKNYLYSTIVSEDQNYTSHQKPALKKIKPQTQPQPQTRMARALRPASKRGVAESSITRAFEPQLRAKLEKPEPSPSQASTPATPVSKDKIYQQKQDDIIKRIQSNMLKSEALDKLMQAPRLRESTKLAAKILEPQTPQSSEQQPPRREAKEQREVYYSARQPETDLDDEEGYLKVEPGHHILNRFEVKSVLGKGSFAQVI